MTNSTSLPTSKSWFPSWNSIQMDQPLMDSAPNSALRTLHGISGLFDTVEAGDSELKVSSALSSNLSFLTTGNLASSESSDLLQSLSNRGSIAGLSDEGDFLLPEEGDNCDTDLDLAGSINAIKCEFDQISTEQDFDDVFSSSVLPSVTDINEDSLMTDLANIDFLEEYTDLSAFLPDGDLTGAGTFDPAVLMDSADSSLVELDHVTPVVVHPIKRTASVAFEEDAEVGASDDTFVTFNPDHNDYTMKVHDQRATKRARHTSDVTPKRAPLSSTSSTVSTASSVPASDGTSKYRERRRKNNIASRRSRETRKQKFRSMEDEARHLEAENERLRIKVADLEKITKLMKDSLVQKLAGCGVAAANIKAEPK